MSWQAKLRLFLSTITVEPVLLVFMIGSEMEYGVYQDMVYNKLCLEHYNYDTVLCDNLTGDALDYVQTQGSYWLQYNNIALMVPSILAACYWGSWGDRYGRKLPLILVNISTLFGYLIFTFMAVYQRAPVGLTLLASFVSGLGGGFLMVLAACMSYLADITTKENRTSRVAILESMSVLGNTLGPFISGYLLEGTGYAYTFLVCIGCNTLVILYIVLRIENVIPSANMLEREQLTESNRDTAVNVDSTTNTGIGCGCRLMYIYEGIIASFRKRNGRKRLYILCVLASCLFVFFASDAENDLTYLYVKDDPLKWEYKTYTQYSSLKNCIGGLMLLVVLPVLGRRLLGLQDTTLALVGLMSRVAGLILLAFSTTTVMMFLVPVAAMFSSFPVPCFRAMLSKLVEVSEQGKIFSTIATIENLVMMIASVMYNNMYPATRSILHGFCFLFAACLLVFPLSLISWLHIDKIRSARNSEKLEETDGRNEESEGSFRGEATETQCGIIRRKLLRKAKTKSLELTVVIVLAFIICWTPYYVMMIVYMFLDPTENESIDAIQSPIFFFGLSNSMINPLIYGAFHLHKTKRRSGLSRHVSQSTFTTGSSFRKTHAMGRNDDPSVVTIVDDFEGGLTRDAIKQRAVVNIISPHHYQQHSNGGESLKMKCTSF